MNDGCGPVFRHSSRRTKLDRSFLAARLNGAQAYDRIAGYFCSSILECAGEALETVVGPIRVICNSSLDPEDVRSARAAVTALRLDWCSSEPEKLVEVGGEAAGMAVLPALGGGLVDVVGVSLVVARGRTVLGYFFNSFSSASRTFSSRREYGTSSSERLKNQVCMMFWTSSFRSPTTR